MDATVRHGGCRCERVRFSISGPPLITMACHCTGCRKMTASAFALSVLVPAGAFAVTAGEPVVGGLHGPTRHFFCPWCMSWMFTRWEDGEALVNVRTTLLDDVAGLDPYLETMTAEKLPWATTPAVESFEGFPTTGDFGRLIAAYRERR
ncbi:MAG: GFA family protein [Caulobacteraceae bacterium]